jgi:hypothetical protein
VLALLRPVLLVLLREVIPRGARACVQAPEA